VADTQKQRTNSGKQEQEPERVEIEHAAGGKGDPGGHITMSEGVVETVAGLAARQIGGIHELGKPRFVRFGDSPTRGVDAEVGEKEAAIDLDVTIEYGCDLRETAEQLRRMIADEVNRMAGRKVVEVNINVHDVHLPESNEGKQSSSNKPRVQ
jgi:uncharacterized alkaline shock family protein YloU